MTLMGGITGNHYFKSNAEGFGENARNAIEKFRTNVLPSLKPLWEVLSKTRDDAGKAQLMSTLESLKEEIKAVRNSLNIGTIAVDAPSNSSIAKILKKGPDGLDARISYAPTDTKTGIDEYATYSNSTIRGRLVRGLTFYRDPSGNFSLDCRQLFLMLESTISWIAAVVDEKDGYSVTVRDVDTGQRKAWRENPCAAAKELLPLAEYYAEHIADCLGI